ncbi:MAG: ImmA/IrrE family metallo-endopeptidase [Gammaproteobacteria bacterium]|nr:ImmA/IrrE family metallo-endopeptidase [Gammaproteobacteria bacterium]
MRSNGFWRSAAARRVRQLAEIQDIDLGIAKIAEDLMAGLNGPPTDLKALATRLEVSDIREDDEMLVAGELRKLRNELIVFLLPGISKTRRRFTLAHELGHAFFENTGRRPNPSRELELICDKFAAEFLMPRRQFISQAGSKPGIERIHELCSMFDTGLQATLGRVSDIYQYRALEVLDDEVVWRKRLGVNVLGQVQRALNEVRDESGNDVVFLFERQGLRKWYFEWQELGTEDHRIGLLRPV